MNGTVLVTTKNPFKYQGLSYNIKTGMMHADSKQRSTSPFYDWSFRWAKAYKNKLGIKIAASLVKGSDWEAEDYRNKQQTGILSKVVGGNRQNDPNYNGINMYGDETSADMNGFSYFVQDQTRRSILGATGGAFDVVNAANSYFGVPGNPSFPGAIGMNPYPSTSQITTFINGLSFLGAAGQAAVQQMMPFYICLLYTSRCV